MRTFPSPPDLDRLRERALFAREETIRLIDTAKVGHYASAFSCAEILAVLYYDLMRLRRGDPAWPDRDRFLLGKGHAAVAVYPILADWEYLEPAVLDEYARLGNPLGDHPDMCRVPGIDFSSGSLGHALSVGVGMALGGRLRRRDFFVFVLLGDGELNEGQVWEAALAATTHGLGNLVAIVDRNEYSLDGLANEVSRTEPIVEKWRAFGWDASECDGHDVSELTTTLRAIVADSGRRGPAVLVAHTTKGKGVSYMEAQLGWHLGYLAPPDREAALAELRGAAS